MSLTIRMRRALAAFRADPAEAIVIAGSKSIPRFAVVSLPSNTEQVNRHLEMVGREMTQQDSDDWTVYTDYHRSRIINGKRLDWYTTKRGNRESAAYDGKMVYGKDVRALFRQLGLKDRA